jgi:ketosteroid isomerase-like protein
MPMTLFHRLVFLLALIPLACSPKRIPGTEINDTDDTRAILGVVEKYRRAVENRDADGVMALVDETFSDDAGTASAGDDLDYARLRAELPHHLAKLDGVRIDMDVRQVDVEQDLAQVVYNYNASFRLPKLTAKAQNSSDIERMTLRRTAGGWKIISGI